jgi:hypothetical protein
MTGGDAVTVATQRLRELVELPLVIPEYQRRYCWGPEQVELLLADIEQQINAADAPPLFLGTIILHQEPATDAESIKDNLVDGQQRCLTLVLLLHALGMSEPLAVKQLLQAQFPDSQSQQNLGANYQQIKRYLATEPGIRLHSNKLALLDQLQFVVISITSIDQAFAFFDSQNTAGKRLSNFDLLKARHLRAVVSDDSVGIGCSHLWEAYERQKVGNGQRLAYFLTEQILARTRIRQRGKKVDDLQLIKEFAVQLPKPSPSTEGPKTIQLSPPTAVSFYRDWEVRYAAIDGVDAFTLTTQVNVQGQQIAVQERNLTRLPLQLSQPLLGGEQFFFYIGKYTELYKQYFPLDITADEQKTAEWAESTTEYGRLLQLHRLVEQGQDAGYSRLIEIWLAMLMFYLDRFAEDEHFAAFAALADQSVFSLRISAGSLRRSTVEKHFQASEIFDALLQCPSSLHAMVLIEKMSNKQAQALEQFDAAEVIKAKKRPVIHRYIKAFKSHYSAGKGAHAEHRSALATVLQNTFFQG